MTLPPPLPRPTTRKPAAKARINACENVCERHGKGTEGSMAWRLTWLLSMDRHLVMEAWRWQIERRRDMVASCVDGKVVVCR